MIDNALIDPFVPPGQQRQRLLARELGDQAVVEHRPAGREHDHSPLVAQLHRIAAVASSQRRLDDVDSQHHSGAAAERRVVDLPGVQRRVIAVVDVLEAVAARERVGDVALALEPRERLREQREDVDLHGRLGLAQEPQVDVDRAPVEIDLAYGVGDQRHEQIAAA